MNALEMAKLLKEQNSCEGIDKWLESYLYLQFCRTGGSQVNVDTRTTVKEGWTAPQFKSAMRARGYIVETKCDDRPCSYPYFEIRLPV